MGAYLMTEFYIKQPEIKNPVEIEEASLAAIMNEAKTYSRFNEFTFDQQKVVQRMIHTTTCFDLIINNIEFSANATEKIKNLLKNGATIISDTNMIKSGLSSIYTDNYKNNIVCYVSDTDIKEISQKKGITRTVAAVNKALKELKNTPVIIACGNAPTMLYAAIETLIKDGWDLPNIAFLAMPVGFINVEESKEYSIEFMNKLNVEGIVLKGRYGGSPLIVSCLHSLYKLI